MNRVPTDSAPSPSLPGPTGPPPPGSRTVTTDDGVPLHVEVDGVADAPLTVVLSHGFTARLGEWELQRAALRNRARLVLWDQRGHGRSGWTKLTAATIDRTGRDLGEVVDATVPTGPIVLAGHSMGGMSILALASGPSCSATASSASSCWRRRRADWSRPACWGCSSRESAGCTC
jgi:pimeloyl-ACP methyl ester carboxylesterase